MNYLTVLHGTNYPITLEQARSQCRITAFGSPLAHPDDADLQSIIISATRWCEDYIRRSITENVIEVYFDTFAQNLELPFAPVKEVQSIVYRDKQDGLQTLPNDIYRLKQYSDSAKLNLIMNKSYPSDVSSNESSVTVTIKTGYVVVPQPIISAIKLIVGSLYENRQQNLTGANISELPMGVNVLLQPYRSGMGV